MTTEAHLQAELEQLHDRMAEMGLLSQHLIDVDAKATAQSAGLRALLLRIVCAPDEALRSRATEAARLSLGAVDGDVIAGDGNQWDLRCECGASEQKRWTIGDGLDIQVEECRACSRLQVFRLGPRPG